MAYFFAPSLKLSVDKARRAVTVRDDTKRPRQSQCQRVKNLMAMMGHGHLSRSKWGLPNKMSKSLSQLPATKPWSWCPKAALHRIRQIAHPQGEVNIYQAYQAHGGSTTLPPMELSHLTWKVILVTVATAITALIP